MDSFAGSVTMVLPPISEEERTCNPGSKRFPFRVDPFSRGPRRT